MKKNNMKMSLKKALALNLRAVRAWYGACPMLAVSDISKTVLGAISPVISIWLSARIVNELAGGRDPHKLLMLVLLTLGINLSITLVNIALERWTCYFATAMGFHREKLYADKLLSMDFCLMDEQSTHDLYTQAKQQDGWGYSVESAVNHFTELIHALSGIGGVVVLCISMFTARVPDSAGALTILNNTLFVLGVGVVMFMITSVAPKLEGKGRQYWNRYAEEAKLENNLNRFYADVFPHDRARAADIRLYRQDRVGCYFVEQSDVYTASSKMASYARGPITFYSILSVICSYCFIGITYFIVCLKAWAGAFGVGHVTQYIGALTSLSRCISGAISAVVRMQNLAPFLEMYFKFVGLPNVMYQGSLTVEKRRDRNYEIEFRDVSFKYPGSDIWALRHVNLRFRVGEKLAVVGRNGSGKTTFIKLLCRMYDPTEGEILLNGIDIRKYDYREYLSVFSVVFQDFKLFALPLGENVAAGSDYSRDRAKELLCRAGFAERLSAMPDGLDTYLYKDLSDKGVDVSGGEAQKIALARALYKDAPFIILDEPTAALDPIAEYEIYSRFNELVGDRTAIYISHRLSSCRFCDVIAVFHEGAVTEHGTHEELVSDKNSKYYELWHAQAQYYTNE